MKFLNYLLSERSRFELTGCDILRLLIINYSHILHGGLVTDAFLFAKLLKANESFMLDFALKMGSVGMAKNDLIALAEKADFMDKQGRVIEKSVRDLRHEMGLRKYHSIKFKK